MAKPPRPGEWRRVTLPNGTPALVSTGYRNGRRVVLVRIKREA